MSNVFVSACEHLQSIKYPAVNIIQLIQLIQLIIQLNKNKNKKINDVN